MWVQPTSGYRSGLNPAVILMQFSVTLYIHSIMKQFLFYLFYFFYFLLSSEELKLASQKSQHLEEVGSNKSFFTLSFTLIQFSWQPRYRVWLVQTRQLCWSHDQWTGQWSQLVSSLCLNTWSFLSVFFSAQRWPQRSTTRRDVQVSEETTWPWHHHVLL